MKNSKKTFSKEVIQNYYEGISVAREDWTYCKGNKKRINECIKIRYGMRDLCYERNDKNGVSFQNGYLRFFFNKLKRNQN